MNRFKTEVELEVYGVSKVFGEDFDVESQKVLIEWGFEIEERSWGIKGLHVFAPDQKISFTLTRYTEDEDVEVTKEFELKDILVDGGSIDINSGIFPETLVLDLEDSSSELDF